MFDCPKEKEAAEAAEDDDCPKPDDAVEEDAPNDNDAPPNPEPVRFGSGTRASIGV